MSRISLRADKTAPVISRNIYGHFSEHLGHCIYGGIFVGKDSPIPNENGIRKDVVQALRRLQIPVLRWPGGCFADEYHWRDGIGPQSGRRRMVNTNWGGVVEDNSFGTHEFMELCRQIGCQPYVNANVGSGTVREMAEWVEYLNSDGDSTIANERRANGHDKPWGVRFWGVGNENWGGGGNMRPEYYADVYRQYQTYCREYSGTKLYKIACGPNGDDYNWTEVMMKNAAPYMDGFSLHYYTVPIDWEHKGSATDFDTAQYMETVKKAVRMDEIIKGHSAIMDRYDPEKRIGLLVDEWGCWFDVEPGTNPGFLYQQNTMRDAMVAALTLNIFNKHCDRVRMANIAQTVNVLQSVILTDGEKMLLTPTYHVFDLYRPHMDARLVDCLAECDRMDNGVDRLSVSASFKDGRLTMTAANLSTEKPDTVRIDNLTYSSCSGRILTGFMTDHNTFERPDNVRAELFKDVITKNGGAIFALPPCSVVSLTFDQAESK